LLLLQDIPAAMQPTFYSYLSVIDLNDLRVTRAAINATFTTLRRRLQQLDPFLPVDTTITPGRIYWPGRGAFGWPSLPSTAAVDIPDAKYLDSYTSNVTPYPGMSSYYYQR
jgi:hypothetical protein